MKMAPEYNRLLEKNKDSILREWPAKEKDEFLKVVDRAKKIELAYNGMKASGECPATWWRIATQSLTNCHYRLQVPSRRRR